MLQTLPVRRGLVGCEADHQCHACQLCRTHRFLPCCIVERSGARSTYPVKNLTIASPTSPAWNRQAVVHRRPQVRCQTSTGAAYALEAPIFWWCALGTISATASRRSPRLLILRPAAAKRWGVPRSGRHQWSRLRHPLPTLIVLIRTASRCCPLPIGRRSMVTINRYFDGCKVNMLDYHTAQKVRLGKESCLLKPQWSCGKYYPTTASPR
jgi:hypothetical protein